MNPQDIKISLVDDEPDIVEVCGDSLELEGFQVEVATSVKEALEKFDQGEFHAVVSDQNMPGQTGMDLLKAIRSRGSQVAFYFTTGSIIDMDDELLKLGITKIFMKPYNIDELVNEIKTRLGF